MSCWADIVEKDGGWPEQMLTSRGKAPAEKYDAHNLFVKHLPNGTDDAGLASMFAGFGDIASAVVMVDTATMRSKGFGFVRFESAEAAKQAMVAMHGKEVPPNKMLVVEPALRPRPGRNTAPGPAVYVKHLPPQHTEEEVRDLFKLCGVIERVHVLKDQLTGASKQMGIVQFESTQQAQKAIATMHNKTVEGASRPLSVRYAAGKDSKAVATPPVQSKFWEGTSVVRVHKDSQFEDHVDGGINLFVFHLPDNWTDSNLRAEFDKFGPIASVKVMEHLRGEKKGMSRGFGFVKFREAAHGVQAMGALNGKRVGKKKLLVQVKKAA